MTSEVLDDGAALGDRFVALTGTPDGPDWSAAADLFDDGLPAALDAVGRHRGTDSAAVAGLLLFEQYAQRLVAPVVAVLLRDGPDLDASLPVVRANLVDGSLRRLAFASSAAPSDALDTMLTTNLDPVAEAVHRRTRVGMRLLRGAVANAVVSSLLHMSWPDADRARHVPTAHDLLARMPGLAGLVTVDARDAGGESWMFTGRNTCCLAFRTTVNQAREQPYCSACPILPAATTMELFGRATTAYAARFPRG